MPPTGIFVIYNLYVVSVNFQRQFDTKKGAFGQPKKWTFLLRVMFDVA
jgi:hypothetical protein